MTREEAINKLIRIRQLQGGKSEAHEALGMAIDALAYKAGLPEGLEDGIIADIIQNLFPTDQFIESESLLLDRNEAILFARHFYELGFNSKK